MKTKLLTTRSVLGFALRGPVFGFCGRTALSIGMLAASIVGASATSFSTGTTNVMNGNNLVFTEATGNSENFTTFTNDLASAFATNHAGCWNFDGTSWSLGNGEAVTLTYGLTQISNVVLTLTASGSDTIAQGSPSSPTSGTTELTESGSAADRTFTPSKPLQAVAIFNLNRGDASRTASLMVTFSDNTTAATSGANGGAVYFHELSANPTNPIVKFTISNSGLNRWDDLAFIVSSYTPPAPPVYTNSVATNSIGVNFVGAALQPTDMAGVPDYQQANWNNLGQTGAGVILTNSVGVATPMVINWSGSWTDSSGTATGLGTPDGNLMDGFLAANSTIDTVGTSVSGSAWNSKPLVYLSGLNAWYQAQGAEGFKVVMYRNSHNYWEGTYGWVQSVSGDPAANTMVGGPDLTPRLYNAQNSVFSGTYVKIPNTATNSANKYYGGGNYNEFTGLTNDAVLIRTGSETTWGGAPLNGIQLVPVFPTLPVANAPTISPSTTVFAGEPVSVNVVATGDPIHPQLWYQWQADANSDFVVTHNISDATNATYSFTPTNAASTYTISFDVIVTNIFGAATSSVVTLTVNPATAPYITTDTTPGAGSSMANVYAFANGSISFSAAFGGTQPITYQWQDDLGSGYTGILNATNKTLTLTNLQLTESGNYRLMAHNNVGDTPSTPAPLTVLADPAAPDASQAYAYAVFTNNPYAYWRFSETISPLAGNSMQAYDYSGHNFNATYGNAVYNQQAGPSVSSTPASPGFESTNTAITLINNTANAWLDVPSLNLNTNTVTITAWIKPSGAIGTYWGLLMWRGTNGDAAGLSFGGNLNAGVAELGYNWNSNSATAYNFHSGLYAPLEQWSFVAMTITPTNTSLYLYYTDGYSVTNLSKVVQSVTNHNEAFAGGTLRIGTDNYAGRNFNGSIDEMSVFNHALSESQLQNLFLTGAGISGVAPYIVSDTAGSPTNAVDIFPGQAPLVLTANGAGAPPPGYQWQSGTGGVFTNINDGGSFSGATSGTLTINPASPANYLDYRLVLTNAYGSVTSSVFAAHFASVPNDGVWTARYQFTNSSGFLWYDGYGAGTYSGPGVLGGGNFWNPIPGHGQWNGGNFTSASDYMDDGATHSGVTCYINNASFSIAGAPQLYPANDRAGLLSQFAYYFPGVGGTVANAINLHVPNGTLNLAFHNGCVNWTPVGTVYTVHGANGDQISGTTNTGQSAYFINHDTSVVITNVQVTNGVISVDATANHPTKGELSINAVEVQLVSYAPPTAGFSAASTNVFVGQWFAFNDQSSVVTNVVWNFGDGVQYTNVNGTVYHAYAAAGTYTVSQTVKNQGGTDSMTRTSYITVLPQPTINNVSMSTGSLVLDGIGGISGQQYRVLSSTNMTLPLASWVPVWTNQFALDGSCSYTNSSPTNSASFFILVSP